MATSIQDGFPNWIKRLLLCHEMLVLIICTVSFLFGLPNVTQVRLKTGKGLKKCRVSFPERVFSTFFFTPQGGIYFFQLIDHYAASISIMFLAFFEVIAISWFYGVSRLCNNVKEMTGRKPSVYFRFCWLIASPLLIMVRYVINVHSTRL